MSTSRKRAEKNTKQMAAEGRKPETEPNWSGKCEVCGASPTLPCTGMCEPCTFGEADTAGGNW